MEKYMENKDIWFIPRNTCYYSCCRTIHQVTKVRQGPCVITNVKSSKACHVFNRRFFAKEWNKKLKQKVKAQGYYLKVEKRQE